MVTHRDTLLAWSAVKFNYYQMNSPLLSEVRFHLSELFITYFFKSQRHSCRQQLKSVHLHATQVTTNRTNISLRRNRKRYNNDKC